MDVVDLERNRIDQALLTRALAWALAAHREDRRKGHEGSEERHIPYASHLLVVCGLVLEHGGSVEQATGALLHDAVEDQDHVSVEAIRRDFGDTVAEIVDDCSDAYESPKPKWEARKQGYIDDLRRKASSGRASLLVSACDKLHNLTALVADLDTTGAATLDRFHAGPDRQHWFYASLFEVYASAPGVPPRLLGMYARQLDRFTRQLQRLDVEVELPRVAIELLSD